MHRSPAMRENSLFFHRQSAMVKCKKSSRTFLRNILPDSTIDYISVFCSLLGSLALLARSSLRLNSFYINSSALQSSLQSILYHYICSRKYTRYRTREIQSMIIFSSKQSPLISLVINRNHCADLNSPLSPLVDCMRTEVGRHYEKS